MYKRVTGVYEIRHLGSNAVYYGSAVCVSGRLNTHRRELRNGVHPNKHLQNVYNKYDGDLVFSLVELCSRSELRKLEQKYIDSHTEGKLLNADLHVCELAPAEVHSTRMQKAWAARSEETKTEMAKKVSATLKQRYSEDASMLSKAQANLAKARASEAYKNNHQSEYAVKCRTEGVLRYWSENREASSEKISAGMAVHKNLSLDCPHCGASFTGRACQTYCSPRCRVAACKARKRP